MVKPCGQKECTYKYIKYKLQLKYNKKKYNTDK